MSDHPDNQFDDDKKISALYRAGSTAQPPAHIDQAIRAKARRSVKPIPQRARPPWAMPASIAAVLILSISLISLIHKEAPTVSDISSSAPLSVMPNEEKGNETIAEKETQIQSPAAISKQKIQRSSIEISDEQASPEPINESVDMLQTRRQKTEANKPSPLPQRSLASTKTEKGLTADSPMENNNATTRQLLQRTVPQPGSQSPMPEFSGLTGTAEKFSAESKKGRHSENTKSCELLTHRACLDSEECSLVMNDQKVLVCNRSMNHCDAGFVQRSDTKQSCEAKQGCVYVSEPCTCPPDTACICDENQLPQCQPQKIP